MIDEKAFALRPIRVDEKNNKFINYEGTTFPKDPMAGCEMYLRRLQACGFIAKEHSPLAVDVLDSEGDILDTVMITRAGFEYLRRTLKFKVERDDADAK